ncbi:N-acetylmuramoyl-L-alanine amidase [Atopococcus tabaci]|uniref:N-acetylmuramoyl-L-alanine amidase n=1 Tax=Atopococcus tabaci TaxID=269774 RepID=UPI0024098A54|nr:N-acetylmuramoyl-L-alanine amidase [Atopococcus tabaci]
MKKSLIIDAGHGGKDPGAVGFGTKEKEWTRKISIYQYARLRELGADVALTRSTDATLEPAQRTAQIKNKYDYCLSNHWNAFNGKARGVEAIHSIYAGKEMAEDLARAVSKAAGIPSRRVFSKKNSTGQDWYYMHRLTGNTRTVILEYGFIDNREDHAVYSREDTFYQAAEAVVQTLCPSLGVSYVSPQSKKKQLYRVQTGAFSKIENAEAQIRELKRAGFDAVILNK